MTTSETCSVLPPIYNELKFSAENRVFEMILASVARKKG